MNSDSAIDGSGGEAAHYAGVRQTYDNALFYASGPYVSWQLRMTLEHLRLDTTCSSGDAKQLRLADVGGGNGSFAKRLKEHAACEIAIVEPSEQMLAGTSSDPQIDSIVCCGAGEWAAREEGGRYDRLLVKEVLHHLTDREQLYRHLIERRLVPSARLLIITRPKHTDYPLWDEASAVWAAGQPDAAELIDELRQAGFVNVTPHTQAYPCEVPLTSWCELVRGRVWSTFAHFSAEELEGGCEKIRRAAGASKNGVEPVLRFDDRLIFITADSPSDTAAD